MLTKRPETAQGGPRHTNRNYSMLRKPLTPIFHFAYPIGAWTQARFASHASKKSPRANRGTTDTT